MKRILLLFCTGFIVLGAYSQRPNSTAVKTSNEQKTEVKKAEDLSASKAVENMVINHRFYFEVNFMSDQSKAFSQSDGLVDVRSQMNYIALDSNKIVLRMESNSSLSANWGFEAMPARGNFVHYKVTIPEKPGESYFVRFNTTGQFGISDVSMTVFQNGNTDLRVVRNNGQTLFFRGKLLPLDQSMITAAFL